MANIISKKDKIESEAKRKTELKAAFDSANSLDEMVEAFKNMETCFKENELGLECWRIANEFYARGKNPEKVFSYGLKALSILQVNKESRSTRFYACVLKLLGSASFELKRYGESIGYLEWANLSLGRLDQKCECVLHTLIATQLDFYKVKTVLGKKEEAVLHLVRILSIKEKMMDKMCVEIGDANRDVCYAYKGVSNFKAALPFGVKALKIYTKHFGSNSVKTAEMERFLGVIYCELGEHDKALELNQLSMSVLKDVGCTSEVMIQVEIERSCMLIGNGEYEEAMKGLKAVVSNPETIEVDRGRALVSMARASCYAEKFEQAKECMKIAHEIMRNKETDPIMAAVGFWDMSVLYDMMREYETALSLLRRVLTIPELPQKLLVDGSTRLFSLISVAGKQKEGISYSEDVLEKLKKSLGPEHSQVGYCYLYLATICWKTNSLVKAITYFRLAKDVMDVSLGPNHLDSLRISQAVSLVYAAELRYEEAIAIQEKVVEGLRGLRVPSDQAFLDKAVRVLEELKEVSKEWNSSWCSIS